MNRILIIEDDPLIAELEKDYLEMSNFSVVTEIDGKKGVDLALKENFSLIILDLMLPSLNGYEICKEIRNIKTTPIIMLTAKKEDIDKIRGFSLGVNDYIIKPFSPAELVARVKAHIKNYQSLVNKEKIENVLEFRKLKIYPESRRVYIRDEEIALPNKEFELLYFLASNPNIVFSKEKLFDRIWGIDAYGDISTVTVHINRLRDKIEDNMSSPIYIETVWGAGYRFGIKSS